MRHLILLSWLAAVAVPAWAAAPQRSVTPIYDAPGLTRACDAALGGARRHVALMEKKSGGKGFFNEWNQLQIGIEGGLNPIYLLGEVHPDTMWWNYSLGNVRKRPFSAIWRDSSDPVMAGLKARPRRVKGRCAACAVFDICGGNTRVRALQLTGDPWEEDPGCYLTDEEIGVAPGGERVPVLPYRGREVTWMRRN